MAEMDEELLRRHRDLILSATGDGVYGLDCEGRTTFSNPAASRLTGFSPEEMIGKGQHDLIHHTHANGDSYPIMECPIHAAFKDGKVHRVSNEVFWRKDGSSFPVEYVSTPIFDDGELVGAVVSFRDITIQKQAEDALRESEERYRKIFDATHDAIFLVAVDGGAILDANEEACHMLGYRHETLTRLSVADIHPDEAEELRDFFAAVTDHGKWKTDKLSCLAKDGGRIPVRLSASIIRLEGRDCALVLAQDMRDYIAAEQQTRKLQSDLHHVSRLSAMGEMASGMAHELNQPLTAVMNYTQASRRILASDDAEQRAKLASFMDKTVAQAERAGKIISGLRKFIRKDAVDRSFEDINEIIEEAGRLALPGGSADNVDFEIQPGAGLPMVLVDRIQIQQVVFNLVRNSVEALADSRQPKLSVSAVRDGDEFLRVIVRDNGPGVADELMDRLFSSFVTTKADGMGLGLSICRSIVEDHGGRIEARPNEGGGMVFQFTLPVSSGSDGRDG